MPAVTVYTKPACPSCSDTKSLMKKLGIVFNEVDISVDHDARKRVKAMGFRAAPVVETTNSNWSGFNETEIRKLVENAVDDTWDF